LSEVPIPSRKEKKAMDLKMNNLEAVAVMNALQHYRKYLENAGDEKGVLIEKKTVKDLISRIESMPAGEVP
jgi:hypothetical protein